MKAYHAKEIRNVAIVGHNSVGKTMLAESMAFYTGKSNRMGSIDEGTTLSDYSEDEIDKKYSIRSSILSLEFNKTKINIIDCPGYADFIGETYGATRVADAVLLTLSAANDQGVEVGTENSFDIAKKLHKQTAFFVNKCDYENANFDKVVEDLRDSFSSSVTEFQFPDGKGENFKGIIDIISMKYYQVENGKKVIKDIPAEFSDKAAEMREALIENIAGSDEELMDKYLEEGDLTPEDFNKGFKQAFAEGMIQPVFCGSAMLQIGVGSLLENIVNVFPSPLDHQVMVINEDLKEYTEEDIELITIDEDKPFSAFVFKTVSESHVGDLSFFKVVTGKANQGMDAKNGTYNEKIGQLSFVTGKNRAETTEVCAGDIGAVVKLKFTKTFDTIKTKGLDYIVKPLALPNSLIWEKIVTKDKNDEAKIGQALSNLSNEDPTFVYRHESELQQTIIEGQGVKHLDIILNKLRDRHKIEVDVKEPKIAYRETISKAVEGSYRHRKQSGGKGQFGEVHMKMRPRERGEGYNFINSIVGGTIPSRFIPAVEKGVNETLVIGVIAGSQVVDVEVELFFGKFHDVDSSEMAFKIASSYCFKNLFKEAKPIILEPINIIRITCPDEYTGDVMGDISSKRGRPEGMEAKGRKQMITAKVPLSELYRYSTTLRSMTQGKALFETEFSHYELVTHDVQEKIISKYEESRGKDDE